MPVSDLNRGLQMGDYCLIAYFVGVVVATAIKVRSESLRTRSSKSRASTRFVLSDVPEVLELLPISLIFSFSWPLSVLDMIVRRFMERRG